MATRWLTVEHAARRIVKRFRDKDYSLCDALSFAVIKRLKAAGAFTLDRHFRQHKILTVPEM